jgi:hypothetical protein
MRSSPAYHEPMKTMRKMRTWLGIVISIIFAIAGVWFLIADVTDYRGWALLGVALLSGIVFWGFLKDKDPGQTWRL